jgi:betaine-aldehyde dehydrogenase
VAAITPWNYPLMQAVVKVAPALAVGCSVVLKPSPLASLTCLELGKMADTVGLPSGALSVVTGGPPDGAGDGAARLLSHPAVDYLSFTGSTRGGREMLSASAPLVRPTGLELGGKSAMVVFEDADVPSVVDWAMIGIFMTTGQICSATSRLLVHKKLAPKLIAALHAAAVRVRVGDPLSESTQMGALISDDARARVVSAIDRAQSDGASLVCGGTAKPTVGEGLSGGYYVSPTVLADVPVESTAWRDEIFGPVLCIRTFETEDEAIQLANNSPYGLAHAVMSADDERCERVAAALDAGTVWINSSQAIFPQTPFGGWKASGFGKEFGAAGLDEYLKHKTVTRAASGFSWNLYGAATPPSRGLHSGVTRPQRQAPMHVARGSSA